MTQNVNALAFYKAYNDVFIGGSRCLPRGQAVQELRNYTVHVATDFGTTPLTSFKGRRMNLKYAKQELLWYLRADPKDDSITQHATMWKKLQQSDGTFYSNYGQYLFARGKQEQSQFHFVFNELCQDSDSRRAAMVLLQPYHLYHENTDVVCTYAIHFCIRGERLYMTVMMRSNDLIWGFTNDVFCFWYIYQMMYVKLRTYYPNLKHGGYSHFVNSMHIYQRHFEMVGEILRDGLEGYDDLPIMLPTAHEVDLVFQEGVDHVTGPWLQWLKA